MTRPARILVWTLATLLTLLAILVVLFTTKLEFSVASITQWTAKENSQLTFQCSDFSSYGLNWPKQWQLSNMRFGYC